MTPKVKICGVTRVEDAILCAGLGADFIGVNFVGWSPRLVTVDRAAEIGRALRGLSPGPRLVGVFVDQSASTMHRIADAVGLDLLQLHGDEPPQLLTELRLPAIKVFHVGRTVPDTTPWSGAEWFLYDSKRGPASGGTGEVFDWSILEGAPKERPFFLAGGLTPENVRGAVQVVRPGGVDVATGAEDAPGIKSRAKLEAFFRELKRERKPDAAS